MKVTWNWLGEYVDLHGLTIESISGKLASAGLHIEETYKPLECITNVVIGYVQSLKKHPDADRLQICSVDIGSKTVQIVTAAPNIRAEIFVPVALDGAHLANDLIIKNTKLRGELSEGMFCSLEELGLEEKSAGVYIMPASAKPQKGDAIHPYLGLDDIMIDFEITANRSDLLSVMGIAREIALILERPFTKPSVAFKSTTHNVAEKISVRIDNTDACYRYTARYIESVSTIESPAFVRTRLAMTGLRPINAIVDATNYIMTETGLPLHAFDATYIENGSIVIRKAVDGERFKTLAEHDLTLDGAALMIADGKKAVALAGIIGGQNSEIRETTDSVILEAALFEPTGIRKTSKKTGISTDSSYQFERGMDYDNVLYASERAAWFLQEYAGGTVYSGVAEAHKDYDPIRHIQVRWERIPHILGIAIDKETIRSYYARLDFSVEKETDAFCVIAVPPARIIREIDVIEEIARLYGYDTIPALLPTITINAKKRSVTRVFKHAVTERLHGHGIFEAYVFPFINEKQVELLGYDENDLYKVTNPLNKDMEYLAPHGILPMLSIAELNSKRGEKSVRMYEWGKEYHQQRGEHEKLTVVLTGTDTKHVYTGEHTLDLYDAKAVIDSIQKCLKGTFTIANSEQVVFEPGIGFALMSGAIELCSYGKVRKDIADSFDLGDVWMVSMDVEACADAYVANRSFKPFSVFPPVYFDLAFVVERATQAAALLDCIRKAAGALLENVEIFDVYEGKQLSDDKKSIAFSLTFRAADRTLTEQEITKEIEKVITGVNTQFNGVLR